MRTGAASGGVAGLRERALSPLPLAVEDPADAGVDGKVEVVTRAGDAARSADGRIRQTQVTYVRVRQHIAVATADGRLVRDVRTRTRMTCRTVAKDGRGARAGFEGPGIGGEGDLFDRQSPERIGYEAAARAVRMLEGRPWSAERPVVVLGPAAGGLLLHEACGHGLEGDGLARKISVFAESAGRALGSELVSAIDDPRYGDGFGSYLVDDEGQVSAPNVLIDRGRQVGALTDTGSAASLPEGLRSSNGRRESYAHPPLARMSNTYIAPGSDAGEDIVSAVRRGLYVARLSGGDVDIASGNFAFTSSEAYAIENGVLASPVVDVTVLGNGPRTLSSIEVVGDDLAFTQAMCGKEDQWIPVSYGSPTLLIHGLTVTGG